MNELLPFLKDFTPGAYGIWTGVLMFAAWLTREYRETRKLSTDDRQARREGYAKQVEMLMGENRALGDDMSKLRKEYDQYRTLCHDETDALRQMIIRQEGELGGYKRRIDLLSMKVARLMNISVDRVEADMNRLLDEIDAKGGDKGVEEC